MSMGSEYINESYAKEEELRMEIKKAAAKKIWATRDGRKINVCDMSNAHIKNVINYIQRNDKTDMMLPWVIVFENELNKRYGM